MTQAIRIHTHGGAEQLKLESIETPTPGAGEVLLRQTHIGVNFIDVYFRTGLYPPPAMPFTPGMEAAGEVIAVGPGVDTLRVGQRVAYATPPVGAYASERVMPVERLVPLPEEIDNAAAAAMMLRGMTAYMLLHRVIRIEAGDAILVHAAAGGVGLILCQWAAALGATVIGTVGSAEKAALAKAHGCQHTLLYDEEDVASQVRELTAGQGVRAVYDSVGAATLTSSLDSLAKRGLLVSFGQSSGPPPAIEVGVLARKGSLFLTRPTLFDYVDTRESLLQAAEALFTRVSQGSIHIHAGTPYPLAEAGAAHTALEGRQTTGSTVLMV